MKYTLVSALAAFLVPQLAQAVNYGLTDNWAGDAFLNSFTFQNIGDPTHGRVNYVDRSTAISRGLAYVSGKSFILRADSTTTLSPSGPGRNSVRIRSNKTFRTHVAVFDVKHMPQGCGTWPAIWETKESNWPYGGEIDILEGVNDQGTNAITLHTGPYCTMPKNRPMTGTPTTTDCNSFVNGNSGCGVKLTESTSYGPHFNSNGGGWYVIERTNNAIRGWFWPRNASNVPAAVKNGEASVNPDTFGTPTAYFPNTSCDLASQFQENSIIINLTFCGDWAGSVYGSSGCPGTCVDFVNNNPGAFSDAYFDIAGVRVYQ